MERRQLITYGVVMAGLCAAGLSTSAQAATSATASAKSSLTQLKVTPLYVVAFNNLNQLGNCTTSADGNTVTCHVTLTNSSASAPMQWYAESEYDALGFTDPGVTTFTPSSGTLKAGRSVKVAISMDGDCGGPEEQNNQSVFLFYNASEPDADVIAVTSSNCDG